MVGTGVVAGAWVRRRDSGAGLLVALTVPATLVFLWQATGSRVQGNWPAILYPSACLAAACLAGFWQRLFRPGLAIGVLLSGLVLVQAAYAPFHLPRRSDPTLARLGGWDRFAAAVEQARVAEGADFVASEEYGLASQLALRLPPGVPVVAIGDRWDLFALPGGPATGKGLLIRSTRRGDGPPLWPAARELPGLIARARSGVEAELYRLYAVTAAPGASTALLPRPR
ncbi:hypothetical protein ROMU108268_18485 [Roseomonas mucosa]